MDTSAEKMNYLLEVVQDLSMARTLEDITRIVRTASRKLTGSDGATFVLRDGDRCHYFDEDAIAPLWKGLKFPMSACISGWVMLNKTSTTVKDIYADPRIPADAYRPTFVKSLAMVPIREKSPIGAIGNYWATPHDVTDEELKLVQALANSASIAIENVNNLSDLERKVQERTAELEAFTYAVSHDLKAPARGISGFATIIEEDFGSELNPQIKEHIARIKRAGFRMTDLIDALLDLSRINNKALEKGNVNLTQISQRILNDLVENNPDRKVEVVVQENLMASGDQVMLQAVMDNLIRNAWKFSRNNRHAKIEIGTVDKGSGRTTFYVRDNGSGFDATYSDRLFRAFHRLHSPKEFEGTGIGLATVQRIVSRHGGRVWANSELGKGAEFFFDLPKA